MEVLDLFASHQSITSAVIDYWKRAYRAYPRTTVAATILVLLAGAAGVAIAEREQRVARARQAAITGRYDIQLKRLDEAERSLRELTTFVGTQRAEIEATENAITALKAERTRLEPLINADRRAVEALFAAQEVRNAKSQARERWFGFGFGVLASLLASLIWYGISLLAKRKTRVASRADTPPNLVP